MTGSGSASSVLIADEAAVRRPAGVRLIRAALADERVLLGAIVLLATAIRFIAIGTTLSVDDGYSYLVGSAPDAHAFLARLAGSENTPPLFYLLLTPLPIGQPGWLRVPAAVPGALQCLVLYLALRRPLGVRVALLAALGVAVAPFLISYSDLTRGFMLEDLALLVALWAMLRLSEQDRPRWWAVYLTAGVVAMYTEYDSAIFLVALTAAALWTGMPNRRRVALLGPLPLLSLVPWIPQLVRAQNAINVTKLAPTFPAPSLAALRDVVAQLTLGENGGTTNLNGRWLVLAVVLVLVAGTAIVLWRTLGAGDAPRRRAIALLAGTALLTLVGHTLAGLAGIDVFNARYLTILIPLAAALGATAVLAADRRSLTIIAACGLSVLGVVGLVRRYRHEWVPSLTPVRLAAQRLHPRTILTDNPVVLYYLRGMHPQLDRPFNLGPGRAASCARPCLIIDDLSTHTGTPRQVSGTQETIEQRWELTLEP
jgi:uncharacterized membrane protein